jgi:outer membrane receptor protein involved in Fe transport
VQYSDAVARGIYGYNDFVYIYSQTYPDYGFGYERQPFSYSGNSRNLGVFFDDTVRVNDRLSFNVGLRYDYNKAYSAEQDELDEFGNPTGTTFPRTDLYTWKNFSPRLGFNLKLTGDGKTVLKGHWGQYHRAIATGNTPTSSDRTSSPPSRAPSISASTGSTRTAWCSSRATATWAWTRTTRARAPTSTS